jgi:fructose-1,6-bisphosphatase II
VRVVTGEGEKDAVEHVAMGEQFGAANAQLALDLAVDPIDGTTRLSLARDGALVAAALVPRGGFFEPGPSHYMQKLVCSARAGAQLDPELATAAVLESIARSLDKALCELRVFVLDKPRHASLVAELHALGVRVLHHDAGDLEAAILAALPDGPIDLLLGIGGSPEGLVSACAVRAIGGFFFAKLAPQRADEEAKLRAAGLYPGAWLALHELIPAEQFACSITGITPCTLVAGVQEESGARTTETLLVWGPGEQRAQLRRRYA